MRFKLPICPWIVGVLIVSVAPSLGGWSLAGESSPPDHSKSAQWTDIPVEIEREQDIQRAVDNGHQPWRLKARDVACAFLAARHRNVRLADCVVEREEGAAAIVGGRVEGGQYKVRLARVVRPDGIWTPVAISVEPPFSPK
jgi:hypothetical protein